MSSAFALVETHHRTGFVQCFSCALVRFAGNNAHMGNGYCDQFHIGLRECISHRRVAAESCRSLITIGSNSNPCGCRSWTDWAQHESSARVQLELLSAGAVALLLIMKTVRMLVMPSHFPRSQAAAGAVWGGTFRQIVACCMAYIGQSFSGRHTQETSIVVMWTRAVHSEEVLT